MNSRKLMLMAGALAFALVSAMLARSLLGSGGTPLAQAATTPQVTGPEVLVATRSLPAGTIITPDAFRYQPWPNDLVQSAYYIRGTTDQATLNGTVVRYPITAGQPITQGAIVSPGDRGFLAAALAPGMRAVTISVSMASGVAGFVFPGDRVDLLLTQTVAGGGDGEPLRAAETIVRNLRVLATDQKTDKSVDEAGKTEVVAISNVTLEATPKISEKIAVAQSLGALSLSLRPIADDRMELERQIAAGEISVPEKNDPKAQRAMLLQVASRPVETDTFTTGAEVSRFARGGVPGKTANAAPVASPVQAAPASFGPATARAHGPVVTVTRGQTSTQTSIGGGN
jgi:pilus assembly protein CpaB